MSEDELKHMLAGEIDKIGFFYNDKKYFRSVNNHNYKKDTKYLHFYFDKKEIERVKLLKLKGNAVCYVGEFEMPFYVIFPYIGVGKYETRGYTVPHDSVYEVALPAIKFKPKYLVGYEKDKNSGPIDFGPIIKFDKRLFYDDVFVNNQEEQKQSLVYNATKKKLEEESEELEK